MGRNPKVRTRSYESWLENPVTGYRRLRKRVPSVVNKENSKTRCKKKCDEEAVEKLLEEEQKQKSRKQDSQILIQVEGEKEEQKRNWL